VRFDIGWKASCEEGLPPGALEVEPPLRRPFQALRSWPLMRLLRLFGFDLLLGLRAGYLPCRLSPHIGVIATDLDLERGALAAGRALERQWLRATKMGLALQPAAAAVVLALGDPDIGISQEVRHQLRTGWRSLVPHWTPVMLFRMGHAEKPSVVSSRKSLEHYWLTRDAARTGTN
jgi:hypothetical protein